MPSLTDRGGMPQSRTEADMPKDDDRGSKRRKAHIFVRATASLLIRPFRKASGTAVTCHSLPVQELAVHHQGHSAAHKLSPAQLDESTTAAQAAAHNKTSSGDSTSSDATSSASSISCGKQQTASAAIPILQPETTAPGGKKCAAAAAAATSKCNGSSKPLTSADSKAWSLERKLSKIQEDHAAEVASLKAQMRLLQATADCLESERETVLETARKLESRNSELEAQNQELKTSRSHYCPTEPPDSARSAYRSCATSPRGGGRWSSATTPTGSGSSRFPSTPFSPALQRTPASFPARAAARNSVSNPVPTLQLPPHLFVGALAKAPGDVAVDATAATGAGAAISGSGGGGGMVVSLGAVPKLDLAQLTLRPVTARAAGGGDGIAAWQQQQQQQYNPQYGGSMSARAHGMSTFYGGGGGSSSSGMQSARTGSYRPYARTYHAYHMQHWRPGSASGSATARMPPPSPSLASAAGSKDPHGPFREELFLAFDDHHQQQHDNAHSSGAAAAGDHDGAKGTGKGKGGMTREQQETWLTGQDGGGVELGALGGPPVDATEVSEAHVNPLYRGAPSAPVLC